MNIAPRGIRASLVVAACFAWGFVPSAYAQKGHANRQPHIQAPRASGMNHQVMRPPMNVGRGYGYGHGYGYGNRNTMARQQNNSHVIAALHTALNSLNQADHDYQGHRVRAIHHVGAAIHSLQPGAGSGNPANAALALNGNGNLNAAGAGQNNRMPQATSDAHLRKALQSLSSVHNHLTGNGSTQHHARARNSVQMAMQELNLALNIR
jgi:hypothetical protein